MDKKAVRSLYRQKRRSFVRDFPEQAIDAANKVSENFLAAFPSNKERSMAGYFALGSEMNPTSLLAVFLKKGHQVFCAAHQCCDQGVIRFHKWTPETLDPETFKLRDLPALQYLFVPLVAFSKSGGRLGQGGGHYDRLLEKWRPKKNFQAIGLAFECQRCDTLIEEEHDQRLDAVVTEKKVYQFL